MFSLKDVCRNSNRPDEPRVGTVTKLYSNFGYIDDNIFFQKHIVIGPMVNVGDTVAAKAVFNPDLPIKWNAEQVWLVEAGDGRRNRVDSGFSRGNKNKPHSSRDSRSRREDYERQPARPSCSKSRTPPLSRSRTSTQDSDIVPVTAALKNILVAPIVSNQLSTVRDLRSCDLANIYKNMSPPVYLYRLKCPWQDSFPITQPFQTSREVRFHQVNKMAVRLVNVEKHNFASDPSYAVGIILLSCPPPMDLFKRSVGFSADVKPRAFTKCINMLTISQNGLRAVGGNWVPELDGQDPATNPQTLINTAIRTCKDMIGLDLSECTRWYRFLEFRYSRSEGQAWPSVDELFAKSERWGFAYPGKPGEPSATSSVSSSQRQSDAPSYSASKANASKPISSKNTTAFSSSYLHPSGDTKNDMTKKTIAVEEDADDQTPHRVVVYFMPDIWSIMPDKRSWETMKAKYQDPKSYFIRKEASTPSQYNDAETEQVAGVFQAEDENGGKDVDEDTKMTEAMDSTGDNLRVKGEPRSGSPDEEKMEEAQEDGQPKFEEKEEAIVDSRKLHHSQIDINALKVSELREQLSARKLDTSGLKNQLSNRLKVAIQRESDEEEEENKRKEVEELERAAQAAVAKAEAAAKEAASERTIGGSGDVPGTSTPAFASVAAGQQPEIKLPVLPELPSLVVQLKPHSAFQLVVCSLETIITLSKGKFKPSNQVYELLICANHILHMYHRDATFTLYKALVVLSDRKQLRSAQNSSKPAHVVTTVSKSETSVQSVAKRPRLSSGDDAADGESTSHGIHRAAASTPSDSEGQLQSVQTMKVVDLPLLFACTLLDRKMHGYFSLFNLETFINSLALPISRYQVRALCQNVVNDYSTLHYRCLTDFPDTRKSTLSAVYHPISSLQSTFRDGRGSLSSASRSSKRPAAFTDPTHLPEHLLLELNGTPISNIDDEEYLEELIRGGDAILEDAETDEDRSTKMPVVALVGGNSGVCENEAGELIPMGDNFLKQLRRMEDRILRLQQTVKEQNAVLCDLRKENSEIPRLQDSLRRANSTADHYRGRCRDRRSTLSHTLQQIEAQACIMESTSSALRSVARRVKRDLCADETARNLPTAPSAASSRTPSVAPKQSSANRVDKRNEETSSEMTLMKSEDVMAPLSNPASVKRASSEVQTPTDGEAEKPHAADGVDQAAHAAGDFDLNSDGSLECEPDGDTATIAT